MALEYLEMHQFSINKFILYTYNTYNNDLDNQREFTLATDDALPQPINLNALYQLLMDPLYGIARTIKRIEDNKYIFEGKQLHNYIQQVFPEKDMYTVLSCLEF